MKQALVLVEGQSEERFVLDCLQPYLAARGMWLTPRLVVTRDRPGTPRHKGGVVSYGQVERDLRRLFADSSLAVVTTLLDYYGLPPQFPGLSDRPRHRGARACVEHVEAAWAAVVDDPRFTPHITLHELEAWVFADPDKLESRMFDDRPATVEAIAAIARGFATPEDIDEGPDTAPSRRLQRVFAPFQKTTHGITALKAIGIDGIRATCPHAAAWLDRLVTIAHAP